MSTPLNPTPGNSQQVSPVLPASDDQIYLQSFSPLLRRLFSWLALLCWGLFLLLGSIFYAQSYQLKQQALERSEQLAKQSAVYLQAELPRALDLQKKAPSLQSLYLLRENVFKLHVGNAGFLFVVDNAGHYLHHPNQELVFTRQQIHDHENPEVVNALEKMFSATGNPQPQQLSYREGQQKVRLYLEPLPLTRHYLGLVVFENELVSLPYGRGLTLVLMILGSLGVCLLLCLALRVYQLEDRHFKWFTGLFSTALLLNIVFLWVLQIHYSSSRTPSEAMLTSYNEINRFKAVAQVKMAAQNQPDTLFIPTGLFVKSLQLASSDTIRVTGYVWQKFFQSTAVPEADRGVVFSDAIQAEYSQYYSQDFGSYRIEGHQFDVLLRQEMAHREYPLNAEQLTLRLVPPNFSKHLILVPELDSYRPDQPIGLDSRLQMEGWELTSSFFAYEFYKAATNFGIGTRTHFPEVAELSLNILVHRKVWGAFILHLVNLVLVLGLLFIVFVKTTSEFRSLYKPLDIFGPTLGLLFPLFLAHYRLRTDLTLSFDKVLYIDYLYFIAYAAITLVILDFSILSERAPLLLRYRNSLFQKTLFWPLILGLVYAVTLATL